MGAMGALRGGRDAAKRSGVFHLRKVETMIRMNRNKKGQGQAGFVVTAELLLITVILVLGLVTGMTKLRDQSNAELSDTAAAIGAINQSYTVMGTVWGDGTDPIATKTGFAFGDAPDLADVDGAVGGDSQSIQYQTAPTPAATNTLVAGAEGTIFTY